MYSFGQRLVEGVEAKELCINKLVVDLEPKEALEHIKEEYADVFSPGIGT